MKSQKKQILIFSSEIELVKFAIMSSFDFGGVDPDIVGNLQRQLEACRLDLQQLTTENTMLRGRIEEYERPSDMILIVVKHFFNV